MRECRVGSLLSQQSSAFSVGKRTNSKITKFINYCVKLVFFCLSLFLNILIVCVWIKKNVQCFLQNKSAANWSQRFLLSSWEIWRNVRENCLSGQGVYNFFLSGVCNCFMCGLCKKCEIVLTSSIESVSRIFFTTCTLLFAQQVVSIVSNALAFSNLYSLEGTRKIGNRVFTEIFRVMGLIIAFTLKLNRVCTWFI